MEPCESKTSQRRQPLGCILLGQRFVVWEKFFSLAVEEAGTRHTVLSNLTEVRWEQLWAQGSLNSCQPPSHFLPLLQWDLHLLD